MTGERRREEADDVRVPEQRMHDVEPPTHPARKPRDREHARGVPERPADVEVADRGSAGMHGGRERSAIDQAGHRDVEAVSIESADDVQEVSLRAAAAEVAGTVEETDATTGG